MMSLKFTKMHGLGNDFMVIDGINQNINLKPEQIVKLAQRTTGIGFDQLLLIEPNSNKQIDFNYRIFNADGHEVGQCGNGARCLALFVKNQGLTHKNHLVIATKTTQMCLTVNDDDTVRVEMGVPKSNPLDIPFIAEQPADAYHLELSHGVTVTIHTVSVGNPHAILIVPNIECAPIAQLGKEISCHPRFPAQTNVGFMQIVNPKHIKLRVYERGCGETRACGSGAVAAAAIGRLHHNMERQITVTLPGGPLLIEWPEFDKPITMTGPAVFVYEGTISSSFL